MCLDEYKNESGPTNNPLTDVVYRGNSGNNCTFVNIAYFVVHLSPIPVRPAYFYCLFRFIYRVILFTLPTISPCYFGRSSYRNEDCPCIYSVHERIHRCSCEKVLCCILKRKLNSIRVFAF